MSNTCVQAFNWEYDGIRTVQQLSRQFVIDRRFCRFGQSQVSSPVGENVPVPFPDIEAHNTSVANLIQQQPSFYMLDRGREQSCIWVDRGHLYGIGYIGTEAQLTDPTDIRDSLRRMKGNHYMTGLILDYGERYPGKVFTYSDR